MGKTRGVHETTPEIRNRMVGMYEAGLGLREIAVALNCSQRTVKRWLNRFDKEGSVETRDRCGRKRITTQEQDEAIVQLAIQAPLKAAKSVLPALGLNCSVDTVRDRLHKAGIYNWNPPKKQIQEIADIQTDGIKIEETVWRPTGTRLGKKKLTKEIAIPKIKPLTKKKKTSDKNKPKQTSDNSEVLPNINSNELQQHELQQPNFSFSSSHQTDQPHTQSNISEMSPISLPLPQPNHPMINCNQNEYVHSLNLMPQNQPTYYHHPGLNISQNWSLDLVQNSHYTPNQHNQMHHDQNPMNIPQEFHTHHTSFTQHLQDQINSSIYVNHSNVQEKLDPLYINHNQDQAAVHNEIDPLHIDQHQDLSELSPEKLSESQDDIINVCSDACSNSSSIFNENSQNLIIDSVNKNNGFIESNKNETVPAKKKNLKKGGKVKGMLETSVEIRNHMIGMAEAGLSTLSIALSVNRSERTVKRWLDRWRKEGSVQTKERKGRKRITTKEEDKAIIEMASQHPLTAAKHVAPALGLKCSVDTVRERLHEAGFHNWKLGKKQGEGNSVHTVKVWQPSGNRSTKIKINENKKKKSSIKKRSQCSKKSNNTTQKNKKGTKSLAQKPTKPPAESISNETTSHFQNQPNDSGCVVESAYSLPITPNLGSHPQQNIQNIQIHPICPQPLPPTGIPIPMQQRPDCRLAFSSTYPLITPQTSANISYPSCMMGNTSHTGHMEQADPMNFEPYIWSF